VTKVVTALQTVQESTLNATIHRLSGVVSGLPPGFQAAIDLRLNGIEGAIVSSHQSLSQQVQSMQDIIEASVQTNHERQTLMEQQIQDLTNQVFMLTQTQEQWTDEWHSFEPNPDVVHGSERAAPTSFTPDLANPDQLQTPPTQWPTVNRAADTPTTGTCPEDTASPARVGKPEVAQGTPQGEGIPTLHLSTPTIALPYDPPSAAQLDDVPMDDPSKRKAPEASPQEDPGLRRGRLGKLCKTPEQEVGPAQGPSHAPEGEHPAPTADTPSSQHAAPPSNTDERELDALYDSSQQDSQPTAPTVISLQSMSMKEAAGNPRMELQPGYSVYMCDRLIGAWNATAQTHSKLAIGNNAAELLDNAQTAERLLDQTANSPLPAEANGCTSECARQALNAIYAERDLQQQGAQPDPDDNQQGADYSL
jgi:hypothetical protein